MSKIRIIFAEYLKKYIITNNSCKKWENIILIK